MNTIHRTTVILVVLLTASLAANADPPDLPDVPGIIGMSPVPEGACMAIYIPVPAGSALTGLIWYNNDGEVVFPEVLVASGVAGEPEPVSSAYLVAEDVSGESSGWSELEFSEPIAAANEGYYVVFRLPEGSEHEAMGAGGGAGLGYTVGANGYTGWLSLDGEDWVKLQADFGMAVMPQVIAADDDMLAKDMDGDGETPVTQTAMLAPVPNPFNPQTELKFQLVSAGHVDLAIYDVKGARLVRLVDEAYPAGRHSVIWRGVDGRGRPLAAGAYIARFESGGTVQTQRLALIK
jgi:hypothetical protein